MLAPKSRDYREARRDLAGKLDRTESLIDKVFREQRQSFIENGCVGALGANSNPAPSTSGERDPGDKVTPNTLAQERAA